MSTPEGRVKAKLDKLLKSYGDELFYFSPQAGPYGRAGIPDRIVCVRGYFLGIEVKKDHAAKPTPLQEKCMLDINKAGGRTFVVYDDVTIAKVKTWIDMAMRYAGSMIC